MNSSATFDVIFVGAGHNALIAARDITEDSGSVCQLDLRPIPVKARTAPSESFMDDPEDFTKRSRTGSAHENPNSYPTYGQPKGERLTATRAAIASTMYDWLCRILLRDALGIAKSTEHACSAGRRGGPSVMPHANAALPHPFQPATVSPTHRK
ncbi:MAG: hypothetical protein JWR32_4633 [Mycobacterium sp.]|jgi:hypothetical protein|nr:hypothetical protein [Mycobacterium sp.]